jgi:hypothetical protein
VIQEKSGRFPTCRSADRLEIGTTFEQADPLRVIDLEYTNGFSAFT